MDYQTLILNTKSVREFKNKPVKNSDLKIIKDYATTCMKLIPSIELDVRIMSNSEVYLPLDGIAGYKGHMIDAPSYLVLLSEDSKYAIENSGYIGQELILKAEEIGVDSCWITLNDSKIIKEKLNIVSNKEVTGLIALGLDANNKLFKTSIGSAYRKGLDEIVYLDEWGKGADNVTLEERGLLDAFAFARLAPSAWNKQPWRFFIKGQDVILTVKKDDEYNSYEERIAAGIIMLFFEAIVETTLFQVNWNLEDSKDMVNIPDNFQIVGYCKL